MNSLARDLKRLKEEEDREQLITDLKKLDYYLNFKNKKFCRKALKDIIEKLKEKEARNNEL